MGSEMCIRDRPNTIAAAVYDGHRAAREMDNWPDPDIVPFKREQSVIDRL